MRPDKPVSALDRACSFINVCAILSRLRRHRNALVYARKAADLLLPLMDEGQPAGSSVAVNTGASMLCIAMHNVGAELEFLGRGAEAVAEYDKGLVLARSLLPADHPIIQSLDQAYNDAKEKTEKQAKRRAQMRSDQTRKTVRYITRHAGIYGRAGSSLISRAKRDYSPTNLGTISTVTNASTFDGRRGASALAYREKKRNGVSMDACRTLDRNADRINTVVSDERRRYKCRYIEEGKLVGPEISVKAHIAGLVSPDEHLHTRDRERSADRDWSARGRSFRGWKAPWSRSAGLMSFVLSHATRRSSSATRGGRFSVSTRRRGERAEDWT